MNHERILEIELRDASPGETWGYFQVTLEVDAPKWDVLSITADDGRLVEFSTLSDFDKKRIERFVSESITLGEGYE